MKKFSTMLVLALVMCVADVFAQARTISGTVISADDNQPVVGATVVVDGTTNGSVTDLDGKFNIRNVDGTVTLDVRYVGMVSQKIEVAPSQTNVTITMVSEALNADEVVVTGLGISRERKALGYSVQDLDSDELTAGGNTNIITSLQGKVSGVEIKPSSGMPGASSQIVIRGARSFSGNNQPLYVVDGMPISSASDLTNSSGTSGTDYSNRALDIDPNDIESMNILKGQAASALYGIRASNGVVVITTKSGKANKNGKLTVNVSNTTSFDVISRLPDMQMTWAQGTYGSYSPYSSYSWGCAIEDLADDSTYGGNTQGQPGKFYVPQLAEAGLDPWQTPQAYDNVKDFFNTGYTNNIAASISKATEGGSYYFSVNNTIQQGIISSTDMKRTGARMSADTKLGNGWTAGFSGSFNQTNLNKAPSANDGLLATVFGAPASYDINNYPYASPSDPYTRINYRTGSFNNPYWDMANNIYSEKTTRFFGNAYFQYIPEVDWSHNQGISFKFQAGADTYTTLYDTILEYGSSGGTGSVLNRTYANQTYNTLVTATYNIDITSDLKFDLLVGNEFNHTNTRDIYAYGETLNFGGWAHIDNTTSQYGYNSEYKERTMGFFANANLAYKNILYLSATVRQDIVSMMPTNNRTFTYPSVSLGYIFTEHEAFKGSNILNFGKIRVSYAEVGQAGNYYETYYTTGSVGGGFYDKSPISYPNDGVTSLVHGSTLYDPNLKPQNTISYEAGFDIRMFNNFLELSYTFSRQNVKDQIFSVPLSGSTGYDSYVMNGGRIHTNAHEINATFNIIRSKDWDFSINTNFTKMDNYVDELADGVESIYLGGFTTPQVRAGIGDKYPVIYGSTFSKDQDGNILVDNDEYLSDGKTKNPYYGMPVGGADGVIGSVSANFNLGFGMNLRWKKVELRATFDYKNGGQMYSGTNGMLNLYGTSAETEDRTSSRIYGGTIATAWDEYGNVTASRKNDIAINTDGSGDDIQTLYASVLGGIDEAYIYDNDYLKLRELSVSYSLNIAKDYTLGLNVFARNILVWTKLPNLDPESSQGNGNMGGAFERFSLPQTTSYGFGLNLTF
ncbi:MAG: SusC/RagA family TonB-linked outer membrane protein [Rikenellaceae bacterium]